MEICDYPLINVFVEVLSLGEKRASKITYGFLCHTWNVYYKAGLDRGKG